MILLIVITSTTKLYHLGRPEAESSYILTQLGLVKISITHQYSCERARGVV